MPNKPRPLEHRVLQFIRQHVLLSAGETVVVAVSGGPDSVCLLHILVSLRNELGVRLQVAHLDHRLRGTQSAADAAYVAGLARRLGVPATIEARDVASYRKQHRLSLEEAAREVRYSFLAEVARNAGASRVAVGHTLNDHLETVLMHIIRGTGIKGLRGLQPSTELNISGNILTVVRPLLPVGREETVAYCRRHRLAPRLDATNLRMQPLRNKIRLELLPLLKGYNTGFDDALLRMSRTAADDIAFIEEEVARLWEDIVHKEKDTLVLDKERFSGLPPALKRHFLRSCIEKLLGTLKDIEERHIEAIMSALGKPAGKRLNLPGNLTFAVEYKRYLLGSDLAVLNPFPKLEGTFALNIPGKTALPGWQVGATILDREAIAILPQSNDLSACFDLDKTGSTIEVRSAKPGDRFQPLGMSRTKKVSDFMVDARIPRDWRSHIPVVCSPQQIIWLAGWRIDERVKVTEETRQMLCLKMTRSHE